MGQLETVLAGRDGRYRLQRGMLDRCTVVVQAALNVPGFPKNIDGDGTLIEGMTRRIEKAVTGIGRPPGIVVFMDNGAGAASLMSFSGVGEIDVKRLCAAWENYLEWGRVLDIDVLTSSGSVSRSLLEMPSRRCIICGGDAKVCARERKHSYRRLRDRAGEMIEQGLRFLSDRQMTLNDSSSPFAFAGGVFPENMFHVLFPEQYGGQGGGRS
ncbi:MAG: citrate lyase holo-[acyl-carrier protein] synthase [Synergistota bacterium]|nr:citrate lyase holo-[acyl-carrier protein] synthase [Synergistota bacterium]